eukprot:3865491-Pyramimonas_sp.AAC.1
MMTSLRNGEGRWEFLEEVVEELKKVSILHLRDWASPDEIFEQLESSIIPAGVKHFTGSRKVRPGYSQDCARRRELLRRR